MDDEKEKDDSGLPAKFVGLVFGLLVLPMKIFIAHPKVFLVFLAILVSVGGTIYLARTNPEILGIQGQSVEEVKEETEKLVVEVGEIIVLPEGETPTVATVTDLEAVKDQTFFAKAQNGDKVLIYSVAQKAYLYRPSEKKIIEVGVVNIGQQGSEQNVQQDTQEVSSGESGSEQETEGEVEEIITPTQRLTPTPSEITPTINP